MLNFIVLGLIPGTHLQITFGWMLALLSLAIAAVLSYLELSRIRPTRLHQRKLNEIDRIAI